MEHPMNRQFPEFDETTAPERARAGLAAARSRFGSIPSPLRRIAAAPGALELVQTALAAFEATSLTALEREVVALTVARRNGCDYCLALHRVLLVRLDVPQSVADALFSGHALPARLEALRRFATSALDRTGDVDDESWQGLLDAGYDRSQALEVVLGIGAYTLTTFANRLTQAPVDV
jgi:uncharacterized peroxidase-related enzyme